MNGSVLLAALQACMARPHTGAYVIVPDACAHNLMAPSIPRILSGTLQGRKRAGCMQTVCTSA